MGWTSPVLRGWVLLCGGLILIAFELWLLWVLVLGFWSAEDWIGWTREVLGAGLLLSGSGGLILIDLELLLLVPGSPSLAEGVIGGPCSLLGAWLSLCGSLILIDLELWLVLVLVLGVVSSWSSEDTVGDVCFMACAGLLESMLVTDPIL
jgi:hypothetical protein